MTLKRRYLISVLFLLAAVISPGQDIDKVQCIKIDGFTVDESCVIVPHTGIYSFKLQKGAISDSLGAFSIISTPGDTVLFTSPGYKPTLLTVPVKVAFAKYTTDVQIVKDTITIEEVIVPPWKTYNEFKKGATQAKALSPEIENMNFNVSLVQQQLYYNLTATPEEGYRFTIRQIANEFYTKGQLH